jgi:hypothetical protein
MVGEQIQDEIQKLKYKEPTSPKLPQLEQELVRAEAQSLVAEAQLTNITRQKFKQAYDIHTAAIIERAEKQIVLAQQARRLINLLDDTPLVPGEERVAPGREYEEEAREVLNDAERALRGWTKSVDPIHSNAGSLGTNAVPSNIEQQAEQSTVLQKAEQNVHSGQLGEGTVASPQSASAASPPYPTSEAAQSTA